MVRHQNRKGKAFAFHKEIWYNSVDLVTMLSAIKAARETKLRYHIRTFAFIWFPTNFKILLYIIVSNCCCNKLPGTYWLKPTPYIFSYSPRDQKSKMDLQGCTLSGGSKEKSVPLPFPASTGCVHPWLMVLFIIFKARNELTSHISIPLVLSSASLFHLWGCLWLRWIHLSKPGSSPHFRVSWLAPWIPSAAWFLFYPVT